MAERPSSRRFAPRSGTGDPSDSLAERVGGSPESVAERAQRDGGSVDSVAERAQRDEALRDEPFEPEIRSSELVHDGAVWGIRRDAFAYGGTELVREYVDHPGAAAVVAIDDNDRVLLIQQYRHPIRHRDWEIPAGLLDVDGEPPAETAKRELAEEVDLEADHWEPLLSVFTTPGGNDEVIHIYLARGLHRLAVAHDREDEEADIRSEWLPLADVVEAVLAGRMRNGILAVGVLAAAERLRRGTPAT